METGKCLCEHCLKFGNRPNDCEIVKAVKYAAYQHYARNILEGYEKVTHCDRCQNYDKHKMYCNELCKRVNPDEFCSRALPDEELF